MQVMSFIEPPQANVIEAILSHYGFWQSCSARAPPSVGDFVLKMDAAYSGNSRTMSLGSSQDAGLRRHDTFLESFCLFPSRIRQGTSFEADQVELCTR